MKKFVEFSLHEYMDEFPRQQVRVWEGETIEAIKTEAKAWAKQMTELYSGGPHPLLKYGLKKKLENGLTETKYRLVKTPALKTKNGLIVLKIFSILAMYLH